MPDGGEAFEGVGGDLVDRAGIVRVEVEPGGEALVAQEGGAGVVGGIGRWDALQLGLAEPEGGDEGGELFAPWAGHGGAPVLELGPGEAELAGAGGEPFRVDAEEEGGRVAVAAFGPEHVEVGLVGGLVVGKAGVAVLAEDLRAHLAAGARGEACGEGFGKGLAGKGDPGLVGLLVGQKPVAGVVGGEIGEEGAGVGQEGGEHRGLRLLGGMVGRGAACVKPGGGLC